MWFNPIFYDIFVVTSIALELIAENKSIYMIRLIYYFTFIITISFGIISCTSFSNNNNINEARENSIVVIEDVEDAKIKQKYDTTYPYSIAKYIKVISYPNRTIWDCKKISPGAFQFNSMVVKDGKLNFDLSKIIDNVTLNTEQANQLFDILQNKTCLSIEADACYEPRHLIIFYDKNDRIIEYIELCLGCVNYRISEKMAQFDMCNSKMRLLNGFFVKIGIKYFKDLKLEHQYEKELTK